MRRIGADDLDPGVAVIGEMILPEPVRTRDGGYRKSIARLLRDWTPSDEGGAVVEFAVSDEPGVAGCPDLDAHLSWVRRATRAEKEIRRLRSRIDRGEEGLVRMFGALLGLLENWGYVKGWSLTEKGCRLRFVYNELDLLLTESIERGLLDGLNAAELCSVVSLFTFESRRADGDVPAPTGVVAERCAEIERLATDLNAAERSARLPETRFPDERFAVTAYAWAAGHDLEDLFDDEMAAGDFVRNCRQLIDVLRQLRDGFSSLRGVAAEGVTRMDRGVVAAGGQA